MRCCLSDRNQLGASFGGTWCCAKGNRYGNNNKIYFVVQDLFHVLILSQNIEEIRKKSGLCLPQIVELQQNDNKFIVKQFGEILTSLLFTRYLKSLSKAVHVFKLAKLKSGKEKRNSL